MCTTQSSSICPAVIIPTAPAQKIQPGDYHATLVRAVRAGDVLTTEFRLSRGPVAGRSVYSVFDFSTLDGKRLLDQLCRAAGREFARDTSELAERPVLVTVRNRSIDGATVPMVVSFSKPLIVEVR